MTTTIHKVSIVSVGDPYATLDNMIKLEWLKWLVDFSIDFHFEKSHYQSDALEFYDIHFELTEENLAMYILLYGGELYV